MNDLQDYFSKNTGRLIHKWDHYFEVYERHFSRFRGKEVHMVEFGVSQGGSLQMWKDYFGPKAHIYGVDINPHCMGFADDETPVFIGDQEDRSFLQELGRKIPKIDILLDDGGHTMRQQINTFEELFPLIDNNGVYLCEDLSTSYWPKFGGGHQKSGTFIEYSKRFIDQLHAWHAPRRSKLCVDAFTKSAHSLHYYDGMLVIEKRPMNAPTHSKTGQASIPDYQPPKSNNPLKRLRSQINKQLKRLVGRAV